MPTLSPAIVVGALAALAVAALGLVALGYRLRWRGADKRLQHLEPDRRALHGLLGNAPVGCFALDGPRAGASGGLGWLLGIDPTHCGFDALAACFAAEDARRLTEAAQTLRRDGRAFELALTTQDGSRTLAAQGVAQTPGPAIWFIDISDFEHAHARTRGERDRLARALDALPVPVWRRGPDLRLIDCNQTYAEAVELDRAAAVQQGAELLGDSLRDVSRGLAERARSAGQPAGERHHVVVAGKRRLMELLEVPLPGGDGQGTDGLVGLAIDRTEAEQLQDELSRHVAAHGEVLESLSTAIAIFGPDLRVKFYNGAYAELWGLEESFLDGEPHLNDLLEALREKRQLPEQSNFPAFKREQVDKLRSLVDREEELLHRPDGTTLKLMLAPHPFGGVLATLEDVTDRLALERNFNTLIDVQQETIENLYEAVAVFGSDGRLKLYNTAFVELWGLPMGELGEEPHVREVARAGRTYFNVPDAHWDYMLEEIVARATEPEAQSGRAERPDGVVVDWAQVPLPDGQSLFTYLDVTDSTRVERALREQAEALETADRLKSEFIANISYELRTPLNAIVGFAEILENEYFGSLNDRQREYAGAIVQSSQRLIGLINDILDLASIEAGYLELDTEPVDARRLLDDLYTIARERAHNRGIQLTIDCPETVGTLVGDARRLKQALFNLVSNAFNFTPDEGKITLAAERAEDEMRLSVIDSGVGIPQDDQANVFHKFVRSQPRKTGAGLGLSLVKSLIELHGGWVELDSAPQQGTRVTCHLPLDGPDRAEPADPAGAAGARDDADGWADASFAD